MDTLRFFDGSSKILFRKYIYRNSGSYTIIILKIKFKTGAFCGCFIVITFEDAVCRSASSLQPLLTYILFA